jgi:hypothetical protein
MVYARGVERVLPLHGRAAVDRAIDGVRGSFDALAFGSRFVGALFGIAFVVSLVWRLRAGLVAAANALAWTAAVVVWWAGLVYSRGALIDTGAFRYQFTSAVFIVLATMPSGTASAASAARWRSPVAAFLVLAFAGVVVWANGDEISHLADLRRSYARATQQFLIAANQGRDVVPDSYRYEIAVGNRTAGEYRRITGYYGIPRGTDPGDPDRRLVALAPKSLRRLLRSEPCTTPDDTISAPPESRVRIRAGAHDTTVSLRRFSNEPATVATVRAGRGAVLTLHALGSKRPWTVLAPGACLDAQRSTG